MYQKRVSKTDTWKNRKIDLTPWWGREVTFSAMYQYVSKTLKVKIGQN